ncbi:MAG: hypothetical protein ACK4Z0_03550 [Sphingomonadaceae bacterium]
MATTGRLDANAATRPAALLLLLLMVPLLPACDTRQGSSRSCPEEPPRMSPLPLLY